VLEQSQSTSQGINHHGGGVIATHAAVAAVPIAAFANNLNPILTAISSLFAIIWFGVLLWDRITKGRSKDNN
jgi:FtsH-binding integral membrane protein